MKILFIIALLLIGMSGYAQPEKQKGYEGGAFVGFAIGISENAHTRFMVDVLNGYRFNPYLSTSIGIGIRKYFVDPGVAGRYYDMIMLPLYGNVKVNFTKTKVSPFVSFSGGYSFMLNDKIARDYSELITSTGGLIIDVSAGIDVQLKNRRAYWFAFGYELQKMSETFYTPPASVNDRVPEQVYHRSMQALTITAGFCF